MSDVNEPPVITGGGASHDYAENGAGAVATYTATDPEGDTIAWSVEGTDSAAFRIGSNRGRLNFNSAPDYETKTSYSITVKATAGGDSATLGVTVTITNVDEAPTITSGGSSHDYAENGTGAVATYTATDPEGDTIAWSVEGTDAAAFSISSGGELTFNSAPDYESPGDTGGNNVYDVTVKATANGKSASQAVAVTVTNVDEAVVITGGGAAHDYAENGTGAVATYTATDPQSRTITWSVEGTDAADFNIGSSTGELSFNSAPDYETKSSYSITVKATSGGDSATLAVTVAITNVDEAPTITGGGASHDYAENGTDAVATYTATDPEGDTITWSVEGTDSAAFAISSGGELSFNSAPDYETKSSYSITVKATANSKSASLVVAVTVTDVNEAMVITGGGASHDYAENGTGAVATYTATDPQSRTITWSVEGTDSAAFSIGSSTGVLTFDSAPDYEAKSSYSITVKAMAGSDSASLAVTVTITNVDESPVITGGGAAHDYAENGTGAVATYTASDPEGDIISWSVEGTDSAAFAISSGGELTFNSAPDYETKSSYSITVKATANSKSASLVVAVTVTDVNEAMVITGGGASHDYAENGTGAVATYTATDPQSRTITWSVEGTDSAAFSIGSSTGVLTFDSAPDYEAKSSYSITVKAMAGSDSASLAVTVTITNVDESPVITGGGAAHDYAENGTGAVATYTASDPEGDIISWSVEGTDSAAFAISSGGELTFNSSPDYESPGDTGGNNVYDVTVKATANGKSASQAVVVTVTNVDEAPLSDKPGQPFNLRVTLHVPLFGHPTGDASDPIMLRVDWDAPTTGAAVTSYQITRRTSETGAERVYQFDMSGAPDKKTSFIDATGRVNTKYIYRVRAVNENGDSGLSDPAEIIVRLDSPERPSGLSAEMSADRVAVVLTWNAPADGAPVSGYQVLRREADLEVLLVDTGTRLNRNPNSTDTTYTDTTVQAGAIYTYLVKAVNAAGASEPSNLAEVTVTGEERNQPPTLSGEDALNFPENGTGAVATYTATDPEGDTIAWSVEGTDAGDFGISSNGELTFNSSPDYETKRSYSITVKAMAGSDSASLAVTVTITNVDEAPAITGGGASHDYAENGTGVVGTYTASDPEGDTIAWTVEGTDAADFSIGSGGELTFNSSPDYETKSSYSITVKAAAGGRNASMAVTVTITDVDEATVPGQITGLTATAPAHDTVSLNWEAPSDGGEVTGYKILRRNLDSEDNLQVLVSDTGNSGTTWTDNDVSPRTKYAYRVRALGERGEGEISLPATVTTPQAPKPGQVTGLTATAPAHDTVSLSWEAPSDGGTVTGYQILRRNLDSEDSLQVLVQDTGNTGTTWTDNDVSPRTKYAYRVRALGERGEGEISMFANVTTPE